MPIQNGLAGLNIVSEEECQAYNRAGLDLEKLLSHGIECEDMPIALEGFEKFLDDVDYQTNFPSYIQSFKKAYDKLNRPDNYINRKLIEQYLSIYITNPQENDVVADLAADKCPLSVILHDQMQIKSVYHQDLNPVPKEKFPYLKHGVVFDGRSTSNNKGGLPKEGLNIVVGNGATLPFDDNSVDYFYLLNSWEHFQAPSDLDTLIEAQRCLKSGGKLLIVPLNVAGTAYVRTDPSIWDTKQVYEEGSEPQFRSEVPVCVAPCRQTYGQHHDARLLIEFAKATPKLKYKILKITIQPSPDWFAGDFWYALLLEKA